MIEATTEERLQRLEARNLLLEKRLRGLHAAVVSVGLVAVTSLLFGDAIGESTDPLTAGWGLEAAESAQPPVAALIRTRRLEIVGEEDKKFVAAAGTTAEGHGFFETWTGEGWRSSRLGSEEDGRGLVAVFDRTGHPLVRGSAGQGAGGEVVVGSGTGRSAVNLKTGPTGAGALHMLNGGGFEVVALATDARQSPVFRLSNAEGRPLAVLGSADNSEAELELYNTKGFRTFEVAGDDSGNGRMAINNADGLTLMMWPQVEPVEDLGDLPPAPEHLKGVSADKPSGGSAAAPGADAPTPARAPGEAALPH